MNVSVNIQKVVKRYGDFAAVQGVDLSIQPREFFTLLGPSGCGKTTLLRMIAGFNDIDEGTICFGEKIINHVEPHKRNIGMVFQNYAIFPHMTVEENVAYGLKAKKIPKSQIAGKVEKALKQVQREQLRNRKPNELSGGQQQRVALARAFVIEPSILLMDEPLSNLDAKLRVQMRMSIRQLQKELGITTIYVTHDQEEALAVSDRIAVIKDGHIMQVGSPEQIYRKPSCIFVAEFIGKSNFLKAKTQSVKNGIATIRLDDLTLELPVKDECPTDVVVSARPEQLYIGNEGLEGEILFSTFLGDFVEYEVMLRNGHHIQINEYTKDTSILKPIGSKVRINLGLDRINLFNPQSGEVISC